MSLQELSEYVRVSKYSKFIPELGRRETWDEQVDRMFSTHEMKYGNKLDSFRDLYEETKRAVKDKKIVGSMRMLQFGGEPALKHEFRSYNCSYSPVDRPKFFQEFMYILLCGAGSGYSVQKHHIAKLPKFCALKYLIEVDPYIIEDSIEGWADSIGVLISSYIYREENEQKGDNLAVPFPRWQTKQVEFDYSQIRPEGAPISTGSKAPGPAPLRRCHEKITEILNKVRARRLTSLEVHDICMHIADAVVSGGHRRSACLSMFSPDDNEMLACKTGNWFLEHGHRGRANNSAVLLRNSTSFEEFSNIFKYTREFGEPGFIWTDFLDEGKNPCFQADTRILTDKGWRKVIDLYQSQEPTFVWADNRVENSGYINKTNSGLTLRPATHVFKTGINIPLYKVITSHGYELTVTDTHRFPTNEGFKTLADLDIGDRIYLPQGQVTNSSDIGNYGDGLVIGLITGDGWVGSDGEQAAFSIWEPDFESMDFIKPFIQERSDSIKSKLNRHYDTIEWHRMTSNVPKMEIGGPRLCRWLRNILGAEPQTIKDRVPEFIFGSSLDTIRGYIQGLFFTDGCPQVGGHALKQTVSLRLNQSNKLLLQDVQVLLSMFGIVSRIYSRRPEGETLLPDGQGGSKFYHTKENFELILSRPNAILFEERIGLFGPKQRRLKDLLDNRGRECSKPERFFTTITDIIPAGNEDTYCLTEPDKNTVIANGLVTGQCVEASFWPYIDIDGVTITSWQNCNLSSINGRLAKTKEKFLQACKWAAIVGTLQAGYQNFPYLGEAANLIAAREALLGVSITGFMDNPDILLNPDILREGAQLVKDTNEAIAKLIGINPAARSTLGKPEGTNSLFLSTASGIHPHHASRYLRRVQANRNESILKHYESINPRAIEESVWDPNQVTKVISFACEVPKGAKLKNQLSALELLEIVKMAQQNWVVPGTRPEASVRPEITHSISNTVNVKEGEWENVTKYLYENRQYFAGVSFIPETGDKDYPQAPLCAVPYPSEISAKYGPAAYFASGVIEMAMSLWDNNLWAACDCFLGLGIEATEVQKVWIDKATRFSNRYFNGNHKEMLYCLKDVYNLKFWEDLSREHKAVDWTNIPEDIDNNNFTSDPACAGGTCDMPPEWLEAMEKLKQENQS